MLTIDELEFGYEVSFLLSGMWLSAALRGIDYRCEAGHFLVSESCVTFSVISNPEFAFQQ